MPGLPPFKNTCSWTILPPPVFSFSDSTHPGELFKIYFLSFRKKGGSEKWLLQQSMTNQPLCNQWSQPFDMMPPIIDYNIARKTAGGIVKQDTVEFTMKNAKCACVWMKIVTVSTGITVLHIPNKSAVRKRYSVIKEMVCYKYAANVQ